MNYKYIIILSLITISNASFSDNKINFSDEVIAKEILLTQPWTCHMEDTHGKGPGVWTFTSVNGNLVRGKINIPQYKTCNSNSLKGKLNKNTLNFQAPTMAQCSSIGGVLNFYYDENNKIIAEGTYVYGGQRVVGRYKCEQGSHI